MNNSKLEPLVSIIIVNWNRCDDVIETLENIQNLLYKNVEIIVVDNGSTDNSLKVLKNYKPHIRLLALPMNTGCEDGNNVGILNAKGEVLLFIDSDAGIEADGISKYEVLKLCGFEGSVVMGTVQYRLLSPKGTDIHGSHRFWLRFLNMEHRITYRTF
jgi:glycosyltransferase involved in cell wall biosynthesis